jgi:hypothetical protein
MKTKVRGLVVLLTCLFITGFIYSSAFAAVQIAQIAEDTNACGKKMTADMKAQKALDILEIQNMAGMHEYYHSALMHEAELDNVWSKRDDISWKNNSDYYANRKAVYNFYGEGVKKLDKTGALWYHMLATPVIVVSGDGQTAKAVWQSFGNVSGTNMTQWTEEKYAMDFIKEDGKWKIWHLRTYVEFYTNADSSNSKLWLSQNLAAPEGAKNASQMGGGAPTGGQGGAGAPPSGGQGGAGAPPSGAQGGTGAPPSGGQAATKKTPSVTIKEEAGGGIKFDEELSKPTENGKYYEGFSEKYIPIFKPVPPSPYCTWKDTKGYNIEE